MGRPGKDNLTNEYLVLPSFIQFYPVLPSFTKFYLVLPRIVGFTSKLRGQIQFRVLKTNATRRRRGGDAAAGPGRTAGRRLPGAGRAGPAPGSAGRAHGTAARRRADAADGRPRRPALPRRPPRRRRLGRTRHRRRQVRIL